MSDLIRAERLSLWVHLFKVEGTFFSLETEIDGQNTFLLQSLSKMRLLIYVWITLWVLTRKVDATLRSCVCIGKHSGFLAWKIDHWKAKSFWDAEVWSLTTSLRIFCLRGNVRVRFSSSELSSFEVHWWNQKSNNLSWMRREVPKRESQSKTSHERKVVDQPDSTYVSWNRPWAPTFAHTDSKMEQG